MKYTVNEYLDLIGSGKPRSKKRVARKPKGKPSKAHMEHVEAVMKLYGMGKSRADKVCYHCEHMAKVKGGSFWDWLKNAGAEVGKAVVGMIPAVGAYGVEGIDALQHHRKYDPVKATKNAAINIGTSFLPIGVKQVANMGLKKATGGKGKGKAKAGAKKPKRKVSAKMKQRGKLVSEVMKKTGMSLGQASKFLKSKGY